MREAGIVSADEFDPEIERLYGRPEMFADSVLFDAEVAVRVYRRSKMRRILLSVLGVLGGLAFLHQIVKLNLDLTLSTQSVQAVLPQRQLSQVMDVGREMASQVGLGDAAVAGLSGPQLLILCSLAAVALLTGTAIRLSQ